MSSLKKLPFTYVVNDLVDSEKPDIIAHLKRLDSGDRYLRFFAALGDSAIEKYVTEMVDFSKTKGYGIYDLDKKTLIAFAHIIEDDKGSAEVGISVDKSVRGKGLAKDLMDRIMVHVKANGIHTLYMSCLRENKIMQSIARNAGLKVVIDHDEAIATLELDIDPIQRSIYRTKEYAYQQITIFDKCYRQNALLVRFLFTGE